MDIHCGPKLEGHEEPVNCSSLTSGLVEQARAHTPPILPACAAPKLVSPAAVAVCARTYESQARQAKSSTNVRWHMYECRYRVNNFIYLNPNVSLVLSEKL